MHSASFGYILSAVFGCGLILLAFLLIAKLQRNKATADSHGR